MAMIKGKQILSIDASKIVESAGKRFVTDVEKAAWAAKAETTLATPLANGLLSKEDKAKLDALVNATAVADGLMSKEDYAKLQGIQAGATAYVHPTSHAATIIDTDETHRFVTDAEKVTWADKYTKAQIDAMLQANTAALEWKNSVPTVDDLATEYPNPTIGTVATVDATGKIYRWNGTIWEICPLGTAGLATTTVSGLMSFDDKTKLDGIEAGANHYVLPATLPSTMITTDNDKRFVSQAEVDAFNAKASTAVVTETTNGLMIASDKKKLDGMIAKPEQRQVKVFPQAGSLTYIATGIDRVGTMANYILEDWIKLAVFVNGILQTENVDYTLGTGAASEIFITWLNKDFELETTDEITISYIQTV